MARFIHFAVIEEWVHEADVSNFWLYVYYGPRCGSAWVDYKVDGWKSGSVKYCGTRYSGEEYTLVLRSDKTKNITVAVWPKGVSEITIHINDKTYKYPADDQIIHYDKVEPGKKYTIYVTGDGLRSGTVYVVVLKGEVKIDKEKLSWPSEAETDKEYDVHVEAVISGEVTNPTVRFVLKSAPAPLSLIINGKEYEVDVEKFVEVIFEGTYRTNDKVVIDGRVKFLGVGTYEVGIEAGLKA